MACSICNSQAGAKVLALEPKRAGHPAAPVLRQFDFEPGDQAQQIDGGLLGAEHSRVTRLVIHNRELHRIEIQFQFSLFMDLPQVGGNLGCVPSDRLGVVAGDQIAVLFAQAKRG